MNGRRTVGVGTLFCQTGELKETALIFCASLLMLLMNICIPRKHSDYTGRNRLMPNVGKRFLMIYLFGKLGENIFTKRGSIFCTLFHAHYEVKS